MADFHGIPDGRIGDGSRVEVLLEQIAAALAAGGKIAYFQRLEWEAGTYVDVQLARTFAGVFVVNEDDNNPIWIGFSPASGTETSASVRVPAGGSVTLPYECSVVSIGGAGTGVAVLCPLRGPTEASTV